MKYGEIWWNMLFLKCVIGYNQISEHDLCWIGYIAPYFTINLVPRVKLLQKQFDGSSCAVTSTL